MSFLLDEFVGSHTSNQKSESDHIHRELLDKWEIYECSSQLSLMNLVNLMTFLRNVEFSLLPKLFKRLSDHSVFLRVDVVERTRSEILAIGMPSSDPV